MHLSTFHGSRYARNDLSTSHSSFRALLKPLYPALSLPAIALSNVSVADEMFLNAKIEQMSGMDNQAYITQVNSTQAQAVISQEGDSNTGTIVQAGPTGDAMAAKIYQSGYEQWAIVEQEDVEYTARAKIIQSDVSNNAYGYQRRVTDAELHIDQGGMHNIATVLQEDGYAIADVEQEGVAHQAVIEQLDGLLPKEASVYQEGSENYVEITQEDETLGLVTSTQIGANNFASVYQRASGVPSDMEAHIWVEGDDNVVWVDQEFAFLSTFELVQTGNSNYVEAAMGGETASVTIVSLDSNFNADYIDQSRSASSHVSVSRTLTDDSQTQLTQESISSDLYVEQHNSSFALAHVYQGGWDDEAKLVQTDVNATEGSVVQSNTWDSTASLEQDSIATSSAYIFQYDASPEANLIASIYQSDGVDLLAGIEQTGEDSTASIHQSGTNGEAFVYQDAMAAYAHICQDGTFNTAVITQGGEGYSAAIKQGGSYNYAAITQY